MKSSMITTETEPEIASVQNLVKDAPAGESTARLSKKIEVTLLTGGFDRPYAFGLAMALSAKEIGLEVVGGAEVDSPEMHTTPGLKFLDFHGDPRQSASFPRKLLRLFVFYLQLAWYAITAGTKIFHILWNNKYQAFDRTFLMLWYKLCGRKIVLTAHNVNAGKRDNRNTWWNRFSLKTQYHLVDHIFVHTEKMKSELLEDFGVRAEATTVIPFGINNSVPNTALTPAQARQKIGIASGEKVILFFGAIREYKGLEYLVKAFQQLSEQYPDYRLIIAGESKKGSLEYWDNIKKAIEDHPSRERIIQKIEFVPDAETELYFKAADLSALPYTLVFQSGVLFLSYSFGLPVLASDVGNFRDDIIAGETGLVCEPCNAADLAKSIEKYFASDLFKNLAARRQEIQDYAEGRHSWDVVGNLTRNVYTELLGDKS